MNDSERGCHTVVQSTLIRPEPSELSALRTNLPPYDPAPQPNTQAEGDSIVQPTEHTSIVIDTALGGFHNSTTDRRTCQAGNSGNGKYCPHPIANFVHGRDLHDQDGSKPDTSAGADTEEYGKGNGCRLTAARKPYSEDDDHAEEDHDRQDVETAVFVREQVGYCPSEKAIKKTRLGLNEREHWAQAQGRIVPRSVQDGDKIKCITPTHAIANSSRGNVVERDKHGP